MVSGPFISIIVPVYKTEKYVLKCLDSILAQTYKNFEVLVIDDGSPDCSGKICDQVALTDDRVKVFHLTNGGVSSARNFGLGKAEGEWICFCDSDDMLYSDALSTMIDGVKDGIDMVLAGYDEVTVDDRTIYSAGIDIQKLISRVEAFDIYFNGRDYKFQGYIWNRMFKREIIKNADIRFDESIYYKEDGLFLVQYMCAMKGRVYYTTKPVYKYVIHQDSSMGQISPNISDRFMTNLDARVKSLSMIRESKLPKAVEKDAEKSVFSFLQWIKGLMTQSGSIQYNRLLNATLVVVWSIGIVSFTGMVFKSLRAKLTNMS